MPKRSEKCSSHFCILSVVMFAFKNAFLGSFPVSHLVDYHLCFLCLLLFVRNQELPRFFYRCIDIFPMNIIHILLQLSSSCLFFVTVVWATRRDCFVCFLLCCTVQLISKWLSILCCIVTGFHYVLIIVGSCFYRWPSRRQVLCVVPDAIPFLNFF